ncbi:meteorin [Astyanax mexicanus]|uniref:Meteorin n=2 Tax=Astyanax mexicanus TaxID=7994 RepID=A0A8B9HC52_ASTMX|nr:meteorin [Astyanax mexicanus]KAG9276805.1 meteorin [Astyanax mexicanus]
MKMKMRMMKGFGLLLWIQLELLLWVRESYTADQCSWRGSGLSQLQGSVEQVFLRCAEGSVEWLYPSGALRLSLSPRPSWAGLGPGVSSSSTPASICVKAEPQWSGAQLYLERDGVLELLVGDVSGHTHTRCFSFTPGERPALFLQATPHQDISRRIAAFRYELRGERRERLSDNSVHTDPISTEGACRPCNDTEMLMAVCTSDFVVRGNIRAVETDSDLRAAVIKVSATRVYRQKFALFSSTGRLTHSGEIRTLLSCGVRTGSGSFLFTGHVHFGEAWLGCAPRYKDFLRVYEHAKQKLQIPCTLDTH